MRCRVPYSSGPRLPAEMGSSAATCPMASNITSVGSVAAMCPTAPDLTSLLRWAPALPRVL
jgi:hypothetical protein